MSFGSLIDKVRQAERALEAQERRTGADWRQFRASWLAAWTPGRIVSAGLVLGFLVGKAEPARRIARGRGTLQLISALAGLFAGDSARSAASEAGRAADAARQSTAVAPQAAQAPSPDDALSEMETVESLRVAGLL